MTEPRLKAAAWKTLRERTADGHLIIPHTRFVQSEKQMHITDAELALGYAIGRRFIPKSLPVPFPGEALKIWWDEESGKMKYECVAISCDNAEKDFVASCDKALSHDALTTAKNPRETGR